MSLPPPPPPPAIVAKAPVNAPVAAPAQDPLHPVVTQALGQNSPKVATPHQISILLVEDDTVLQELYFDRFSRSGLQVYQAFDGQEAIDMIQQHQDIDLILLDLMLPKLSGFDVLMHVRKTMQLTLPVVVVSALSDIDDQARSLQLGANEYITKGEVLPSTVIEKIHRYASQQPAAATGGVSTPFSPSAPSRP